MKYKHLIVFLFCFELLKYNSFFFFFNILVLRLSLLYTRYLPFMYYFSRYPQRTRVFFAAIVVSV